MLIRNRLFKRIIAMILVFAMLLSYAPDKVFARDGGDGDPDPSSGQFSCDGFRFIYNEVNSWNNYSNAEVTIYNDSENDKSLWNMTLTYDGVIENIWNADIVECKTNDDGSYSYIIAPKTYNNTIVSGNCVSFGFIAYGIEKSPDMPMFMGFYNDQLSENEAGSDQNENPEIINGREYPIKEEWKALEYTLFSDAEKQSFNVNSMAVEGSVHTNGNFIFEGNSLNIAGTLESAAGITLKTADMPESQSIAAANDQAGKLLMPDITERIHEIIKKDDDRQDESCFEVYSNYTSFGSDHISLDKNIYVEDGLSLKGTTFDTSGIIMAKKDVEFNINDMNQAAEDVIFFASEEGNITINGTNINLKAVLYAPNGNVTINCNELHLTGRIIAKNIMISGTLIDIKSDSHDLDMLDDIGVFYHESLFSFSTKEEFENKISLGDYETEAEFDKVVVTDSNIYTENDPETESIKAGLVLEKKNDENGESYSDEGSWTAFCDSKQDDAVWSYFDLDALYPNDSRIELYGYASNDPNDLKNEIALDDYKKITYDEAVSFDGVSGIKGRYLSVKIIIKASSDNRSPFISKLLIAANTKKSAVDKQKEYVEKRVEGKDSLETNENAEYKYRVVTTRENYEKVIWQLDDEIKEVSENDGSLSCFSFDKGGNYVIKAYYKDEEAEYATILVTVNSKELVTEPATEPNTEANTEPVTEPATEPNTEANTESATEPVTEPNTEPATEPDTEPVTEPNTEPATEPVTEPNTEPATEANTEPETDPITEPVVDETTGEFFKTFDTKADFSTSNICDCEPEYINGFYGISYYKNNFFEEYGAAKGDGLALSAYEKSERPEEYFSKSFNFGNLNVNEDFNGKYAEDGSFEGEFSVKIDKNADMLDELLVYNGHTYLVSTCQKTWDEAEKYCEELGGHLVVIDDKMENDKIAQIVQEKTNSHYTAIGFSDDDNEGVWSWVNGSKNTFTNWRGGEPNNGLTGSRDNPSDQDHAFMYDDGTWDDGYDSALAYFVCEWDEIKNIGLYQFNTVALKMTISSEVDIKAVEGSISKYDIKDLPNGEKELLAIVNLGKNGEFNLPISLNKDIEEEKNIIRNISIFYCEKDVKVYRIYDIKINGNSCIKNGDWFIVYDSGIEGAEWSYFDMDTYIHNNGIVEVSAAASDYLEEAKNSYRRNNLVRIDEYGIGGLCGRYVVIAVHLVSSDENISPFVDKITIGANTDKKPVSKENKFITKSIKGKTSLLVGEAAPYYANIIYMYPTKINYYWMVDDEALKDHYESEYSLYNRFFAVGSYKIRLHLIIGSRRDRNEEDIYLKVDVKDDEEKPDTWDIISSQISYRYFNASIDKAYYNEGDDVIISTDFKNDDEACLKIYYDGVLQADTSIDGEITIPDVKKGYHEVKLEAKTIYGNSFSRIFNFNVISHDDNKLITLDKEKYYNGDDVIVKIPKEYEFKHIYVDGADYGPIEDDEKNLVTFKNLSIGSHKFKIGYIPAESNELVNYVDVYVYVNAAKIDYDDIDLAPPKIEIRSPETGDSITDKINVIGSISDDRGAVTYTVSYKFEGQDSYTEVSSGNEAVNNKVLAIIDEADISAVSCEIKIQAEDKAGNKSSRLITLYGSPITSPDDSSSEYELSCSIKQLEYKKETNELIVEGVVDCDGYLDRYYLSYKKEGTSKETEISTGISETRNKNEDICGDEIGVIKLDNLSEGKYYIELKVNDIYGNQVSTSVSFTYNVEEIRTISFTHTESVKTIQYESKNDSVASSTDASKTDEDDYPDTIKEMKKGFKLSLSYLRAAAGQDVRVYVIPGKGMKSESLKIYKGDELLTEKDGKIHFTSEEAGKVTIKAVYCLDEKNQLEGRDKIEISADCIFFDDTDIVAPTGEFIAPDFDEVITKPVKVYGSVHDEKRLDFWRLEYKLLPDGDYKTISTGNENIEKGELGEIDPTLLVNGEYELRLWIQDMGGNYITVKEKFHVEGNLKIGNFHIGFTDMVVDMAGTKVNVNRIYDSRCPSNG